MQNSRMLLGQTSLPSVQSQTWSLARVSLRLAFLGNAGHGVYSEWSLGDISGLPW